MKKVLILLAVVFALQSCDSDSGSEYRPVTTPGGYNPSFTGSSSNSYVLRTVTAFYSSGTSAGRFEVIQKGNGFQYARRVGGTLEYQVNPDHTHGYNYVFWDGASWLYFY